MANKHGPKESINLPTELMLNLKPRLDINIPLLFPIIKKQVERILMSVNYQSLLIGVKREQPPPSKIKDFAVHAGLFLQLNKLKVIPS